ncbi:MAG TPA: carbohydrate porin [Steroidobacter sp.]|uniref:carbohydrate porin n=1 Tax=Steroidobacter sp. TaxID=1978227 RepID=UPI002ED7C85D
MSAPKYKLLASAVAVLCAIQARADDAGGFDHRITGDWRGMRTLLAEGGLNLSLGYVGEWVHNASGGERSTTAYADQIAFGADLDFESLLGWPGGSLHLVITNRNGPQLDAEAGLGTLLETHEIFGRGHYTRLTRFYLQQDLLGGRVTFKAGRSDVDFFPFSCDFINISFCGALPGYHSNGWYTWPIGQYFANVTIKPGAGFYVKAGANDVNPRNLDGDQGLRLHTRDNPQRGTLANVEAGWLPQLKGELSGSYRIGYWRNSTGYPDLLLAEDGSPVIPDSSSGYYALVQQQLANDGAGGGLSVFANFSHSDRDVNKVDRLWSLGLWYTGITPSRPHDRVGLALGHNRVSGRLRGFGAEKPVELNYSFAGPRGFVLMPSLQYVGDAGGHRDAEDIWIVGVKLSAEF